MIIPFILVPFLFYSQTDKITIKKEDTFYFFQAGKKTDTISAGKNDQFFLKLSGKTSCTTRIEVVNGRLYKTNNDSVFQLKKAPNLQYEHYFMDSVFVAKPGDKKNQRDCHKFVTHINGANEGNGSEVTIQFYNINTRETILVNKFYYR
jgi:hypothetical protein